MIKVFVEAWEQNKKDLELRYNKKRPSCYSDIVRDVIKYIINPYMEDIDEYTLDIKHITTIDNGDYQGTLLYIIPRNMYQPTIDDYYYTCVDYGTCSQCDTFEAVLDYKSKKDRVNGFMTLALHILQEFKQLG